MGTSVFNQIKTWVSCGAVWLAAATPAHALLLDFEEPIFDHRDVVDVSHGVEITTENLVPGHGDYGVVFDTTTMGNSDDDLEIGDGWDFGNLPEDAFLGNILIIQEDPSGCGTGTCDVADDEAARPAGSFTLDFGAQVFESFAFDLVDVENASLENGSVQFLLGGNPFASFSFASFLGLGQGVEYGNNSANHVNLGYVGDFDEIVITMGGSSGIDNVRVEAAEPSTLLLLLGVGAALVCRRRRTA